MVVDIPGFLLTETVTYRAFTAPRTFAAAQTVRAHVQECRKLVTGRGGMTAQAGVRVFLRLGPTLPVGSRVTARGTQCTVVKVDVHNSNGLATPDHLDVYCELVEFQPTTTVTITRGTPAVDGFGDPIDSNTVIATGVPAGFVKNRQQRWDPTLRRDGVSETWTIRLGSTVDVLEGDRVTDVDDTVFQVMGVERQPSPTGPELGDADVRVLARRVAATSLGVA